VDSKFQFRATLGGLAGPRDARSGQRRRVVSSGGAMPREQRRAGVRREIRFASDAAPHTPPAAPTNRKADRLQVLIGCSQSDD
jgi:hypothetical protein